MAYIVEATHALENEIRGNLQNHDAKKHQLVSQIDGILVDMNVLRKAICECTSKVHTIELKDEQAEKEKW